MAEERDIPQEDWVRIVESLANEHGCIHIPGVFELVSEYYSNDAIKLWEEEQEEEEEARDEWEQAFDQADKGCPVEVKFFARANTKTPGPRLGPFGRAFIHENAIYGDDKAIATRSSGFDLWYICEDFIPRNEGIMDPAYVHGFTGIHIEKA